MFSHDATVFVSRRLGAIEAIDILNANVGIVADGAGPAEIAEVARDVQDALRSASIHVASLGARKFEGAVAAVRKLDLVGSAYGMLPFGPNWFLPRGAGHLHVCRAEARRARRKVSKLAAMADGALDVNVLLYLELVERWATAAGAHVAMMRAPAHARAHREREDK